MKSAVLRVDRDDLGSGGRPRLSLRPGHRRSATPCSRARAACRQPSADEVTPSPAKPTTALSTTSAPPSAPRSPPSPSGPVQSVCPLRQEIRPSSDARFEVRRPAATTSGRSSCSLGGENLDRVEQAPSATTSKARVGPITSTAWVPIEPVDPTRATFLGELPVWNRLQRPRPRLIPSAPVGPGSRSPAARTATRRTGRASHRGRATTDPMSFKLRSRFTSDSHRSPIGADDGDHDARAARPSRSSTGGCARL